MGAEEVTYLLALDGGGPHSHVALARGETVLGACTSAESYSSEELLELVDSLLAEHGVTRVDRIAVALGPGSFTGIRSAIATAQGLALAFGAPLAGVPTLAARLGPETGVYRPYLALNEREVGAARYEVTADAVREVEGLSLVAIHGVEGLCVDESALTANPAALLARSAQRFCFGEGGGDYLGKGLSTPREFEPRPSLKEI